jgi:hypothetical protein
MKFLHLPFQAKAKDKITVTFDKPTNVYLLHKSDFAKYKLGKSFRYLGGKAGKSPVEFTVPNDGTWHAVIEKGSHFKPLEVKGSAKLFRPKHLTLNGQEQMETHQQLKGKYDDTLD